MRQLLSDLVVVDLSREPAGSYCGKVFADMGADVVKIEPPDGDRLRAKPAAFVHLNTNKRSVVVDEGTEGTELLEGLLDNADLVIETKDAGDLAVFGTSVDAVRASRPATVVTTISGFGATGPYAPYRWTDLVVQAVSGSLLPSRVPVKLPGMVGLCTVGHVAAVGALAGVLRSRATGAGAHVDCAAYEALATVPSRVSRFLGWEYSGHSVAALAAPPPGGTLIPIGLFPCADGYVSMMSTPQQLNEMLDVLDDDALREAFARPDAYIRPETREALDLALYPWLTMHTRAEVTEAAQAAGWPVAGVNSPREVLDADHLHQRGYWVRVEDPTVGPVLLAGPPYRHAEGGWRLRRRAPLLDEHGAEVRGEVASPRDRRGARGDTDAPPAQGVRVVDMTTVWSGPYLTQLLGDLGAEVIRVENPSVFPPTTKGYEPRPRGDMPFGSLLAMYGPRRLGVEDRPYNRHAMNNSIARNKLSCTLDPRRPDARELLMRLVEQSDVFVENFKASTLHRIGIHESELLDRNPRLVVVRIPPAGLTGDWASYTGFGAQFDGLSGLAYLTGHADSELVDTPSTMHMDAATGPAGAFAVLAALHYRDATGRGQVVELAQMENVLSQLGDLYVQTQLGAEPPRLGSRDAEQAPHGVYPCLDGRWLAISVTNEQQWIALAGVMAAPTLANDSRFADAAARRVHHDELDTIISEWTRTQDVMEAFHALQAAGIPAGPQLDNDLMVADPHVAARGWLRLLETTDVGTHLHAGHAFGGLPQVWRRGSPSLGEDNEYVFKTVLGLADAEYDRLVAESVIVNDYLDPRGAPV